jgi:hypothetical protein
MPRKWQPLVVALAFIALVGLIFVFTMERMNNTDDFLKDWAALGPIFGVVTGLIPTYFFNDSAQNASARVEQHAAENGRLKAMMRMKGIDPETGEEKPTAPAVLAVEPAAPPRRSLPVPAASITKSTSPCTRKLTPGPQPRPK